MRVAKKIAMMITFLFVFQIYQVTSYSENKQVTQYSPKIIFGDDINYPPYSFIDEKGQPAGFNVELARAVGQAMGYEVEIRLGEWSKVIAELEEGKIDAISGMFSSPEREKEFDFTGRHNITNGDVFTHKRIQLNGIEDLKGQTIVVQKGDIVGEYLEGLDLDMKLVKVPTVDQALKLVEDGRYDYAAVLKLPGICRMKDHHSGNIREQGLQLPTTNYCMAVKKGNDNMRMTLNGGLQIVKATGEYDEIYDKWLGIYEEQTILTLVDKYKEFYILLTFVILMLVMISLILKNVVHVKTQELVEANLKLHEEQAALKKLNLEHEINKQALMESETKYRILVSNVPGAIFRCQHDADWTMEFITKDIEVITGYNAAGFIHNKERSYASIIHKEDQQRIMDITQRGISRNHKYRLEYRIICADGSIRWISENAQGAYTHEGQCLYIYGIINDITDLKQMENLLFIEKEQFKTTLLSVGDGVISTDNQCNVVVLNKVAEKLTGWKQEEAVGKPLEEVFNVMNGVTREPYENPARTVLETGKTIELGNDTILISKGGMEISIEDSAAPIKDEHENTNGVVLVFRDFTDKKEKQEKIKYLSFHDQLTGLYNRKFYEEELRRLDQETNLPIGFIMFDVNGLKLTNDAFGHQSGDLLLMKFAEVLKKQCQEENIIARIGGDEFVVLLTKTSRETLHRLIRRIHEAIKHEKIENIVLSLSSGFALKESMTEDMGGIFKKAEDDMYRRKLSESGSMRHETIKVIIKTLYEKSKREERHSKRVSQLCAEIGNALGLSHENINELRTAGLMHDIGKITVDDKTLNKPSDLSDSEWSQINRHPEVGYNILRSVNEYGPLAEYVLAHHERWDGKGYPKGLKGHEIPLQARIIAVADAYDAMTSDRAYRKGLSKDVARAEILKNAGTQFDADIAKIFINKVLDMLEKE